MVVIGRHDDPHLHRVGAALAAKSFAVKQLRLGMPAASYDLSWRSGRFTIQSPDGELSNEDFEHAKEVLYFPFAVNDPPEIVPPDGETTSETAFMLREWRESLFSALRYWRDCSARTWITTVEAAELQARKLYLLSVAMDLGFDVPLSVVSTRLTDADIETVHPAVAKGIGKWQQIREDRFFTTTPVSIEALRALAKERAVVPSFVQRALAAQREYRVYTVKERTIVVALKRNPRFSAVDIRNANQGDLVAVQLDPYPTDLDRLHKIKDALGLVYCVFDVLSDAQGYHLVDINPVGSWFAYDPYYGLDLTQSLVDAILS